MGDVVLYWSATLRHADDPARRCWKLAPSPAIVLEVVCRPGDDNPASVVYRLAIFGSDGFPEARDVIGARVPTEGCWTPRGVESTGGKIDMKTGEEIK